MKSRVFFGPGGLNADESEKKPQMGLPLSPRRVGGLEKFTRKLDEFFQEKIEKEKAQMIEKYFGKDSQTNLFKKFLEEKAKPTVGK